MALSVSKAKDHCGYNPRPQHKICSNCGAFRSELKLPEWMVRENARVVAIGRPESYTVEKNGVQGDMRCSDHGFAVKKTATCKLWRPMPEKP